MQSKLRDLEQLYGKDKAFTEKINQELVRYLEEKQNIYEQQKSIERLYKDTEIFVKKYMVENRLNTIGNFELHQYFNGYVLKVKKEIFKD